MKFISIVDSFKGSMSSLKINEIICEELNRSRSHTSTSFPISDGGEGLIDAISNQVEGCMISVPSVDFFMNPIEVEVYRTNRNPDCDTYWVDSAQVIGLNRVKESGLSFKDVSSYPLGVLLKNLSERISSGDDIALGLGGSGTVDGGLGILQAFGGELFDKNNQKIPVETNPLFAIENLTGENIKLPHIHVLSDVTNTYAGKNSGIVVYSKQKGANEEEIRILNQKVSEILNRNKMTYLNSEGTGAAGGISGMLSFMGAKIHHGFTYISEAINIEAFIKESDIVLTGEGYVDHQTSQGKLVHSVASLAKKHNKKVIVISGQLGENLGELSEIVDASFSIQRKLTTLDDAMNPENVEKNIRLLIHSILGIID